MFGTLVVLLVVSALAEGHRPLSEQSRAQLGRRWISNLSLLLLNQLNLTWVIAFSAVALQSLGATPGFGLAPTLGLGFWSSAFLALILFEFINYWFHRALHRYPLLWRIHAVHHCDTELDSSTTFRNHPLELLVIAPFTVPLVYLLGFPAAAVVLFQIFKATILVFAHSNVKLPKRFERKLRLFITTPDYHRVHHAAEQRYTDSNFSTVLPVFDHLFGTYQNLDRKPLLDKKTGLHYMNRPEDSRLDKLLLLPFLWHRMVPAQKRGDAPPELARKPA